MSNLLKFLPALAFIAVTEVGAVTNPCSIVQPEPSPAHPSSTDVVRFRFAWSVAFASWGKEIFARTSVDGSQAVILELLLKDTADPVPGYQHVGSSYDGIYPDASGDALSPPVGPLPVGRYVTLVKAYYQQVSAEPGCSGNGADFTVATQSAPVTVVPVVEFYNVQLDHYFMTQNVAEIADLDSGKHVGWKRTGEVMMAYAPLGSDSRGSPACRWYAPSPNLDTHFFSASVNECARIGPQFGGVWQEETSNAFEMALPDLITGACPADTTPVYRLWNGRADSNHRYMTSLQIRSEMRRNGYIPEGYGDLGVAMCAPS